MAQPQFYLFNRFYMKNGSQSGRIHEFLGIRPLLYTDTEFGPGKPCPVYLTPFASLAEREEKWSAFSVGAERRKLKVSSAEQHGPLTSTIDITPCQATEYSPVR